MNYDLFQMRFRCLLGLVHSPAKDFTVRLPRHDPGRRLVRQRRVLRLRLHRRLRGRPRVAAAAADSVRYFGEESARDGLRFRHHPGAARGALPGPLKLEISILKLVVSFAFLTDFNGLATLLSHWMCRESYVDIVRLSEED